jgi:hypothetical protein
MAEHQKCLARPIVTRIAPAAPFYAAEDYHFIELARTGALLWTADAHEARSVWKKGPGVREADGRGALRPRRTLGVDRHDGFMSRRSRDESEPRREP